MEEYAYLIFQPYLWRVNLSKLSEDTQPPMEKVVEFQEQGLPMGSGFFTLGSQLYMTGGEKIRKDAVLYPGFNDPYYLSVSDADGGLNSSVFVFDPSDKTTPFKVDHSIVPMHVGKTRASVAKIDGKIYVLSGCPICFNGELPAPGFECYDPTLNSWEPLPQPPFYGDNYGYSFNPFDHYVIGRKIYALHGPGIHFYDVDNREWKEGESFFWQHTHRLPPVPSPFFNTGCIAEGPDGLIIAYTKEGVVAYLYDPDGTLMRHQKLSNLNASLDAISRHPNPELSYGYVNHLGDGKYCLVLSIYLGALPWAIVVSTFQVETLAGTDNGGEDFLNADLLHYHTYNGDSLGSFELMDVFTTCERSKKHGSECLELDGGLKKQKKGFIA